LDFPHNKKSEYEKQNQSMAARYGVQGFPTVLFLNPQGKEIGRSGYRPGGPKPWIEDANRILQN